MWMRTFPARTLSAFALVALLGITSCGGDDAEPTTDAQRPAASVTSTTRPDPGEGYCAAIADMARLQPAGSLTGEELEAAMTAYAESVERVATLSPTDEAATLQQLADALRAAAVDPTAPDLAQRMSVLGPPVAAITLQASRDCGVDFDAG